VIEIKRGEEWNDMFLKVKLVNLLIVAAELTLTTITTINSLAFIAIAVDTLILK
jgi:hypothetical protein